MSSSVHNKYAISVCWSTQAGGLISSQNMYKELSFGKRRLYLQRKNSQNTKSNMYIVNITSFCCCVFISVASHLGITFGVKQKVHVHMYQPLTIMLYFIVILITGHSKPAYVCVFNNNIVLSEVSKSFWKMWAISSCRVEVAEVDWGKVSTPW